MEILLIDNHEYKSERFREGDTLLKVKVDESECGSRVLRGNSSNEAYRKKVVAASKKYFKSTARSLCIHVKKNPQNLGDSTKCMVRVHGFLWENLGTIPLDNVRVRLQLCFYPYVKVKSEAVQLSAEIPIKPSLTASTGNFDATNEGCLEHEGFVEAKNVKFIWNKLFTSDHGPGPTIYAWVTISLVSDYDNFATTNTLNTYQTAVTQIFGKILHSKIFIDMAVVANNDEDFPCNKNVLAAHSPVFAEMLETANKEDSKIEKLQLKDLSPDGVKAMLEFMYTCDLKAAKEHPQIALELLNASCKYKVELLHKNLIGMLMKREIKWFNIDTAFNIFLISTEVDSMQDLKIKSAAILLPKSKLIKECATYKNQLEENPVKVANALLELSSLHPLSGS